MTIFEFLETPIGVQVAHAVIVLVLAIAAYLTYLTKRQADANAKLLNGHLREHQAVRHRRSRAIEIKEKPLE